jgi:uncharacterized protein (TIGR00645 family)
MNNLPSSPQQKFSRFFTRLIFSSRWLQAPLYLGLIIALSVYVYEFSVSLYHLVTNAVGLDDTQIMLHVLDLIDVVMIANLLIMVIVGGYETFVSRLRLEGHPDHPEWLSEVNAGTMKIKLAIALIGISSIHLLRTFIDPGGKTNYAIMWQVVIHMTLIVSAVMIALTNKLMVSSCQEKSNNNI